MNFLPIVGRELRLASRRRATFWIRWGSALGLVVLCALLWATGSHTSAPALSHFSFVTLGAVVLGFCMVAGVFLTADCLSEEKREGTLGLLFLTDLTGFDVVFGKLASTSTNAVYGLLAVFPILGIPLVVGGVTGAEFSRLLLMLLATLFLSLSLGMLSSAFCREARQSMGWTFGAMMVLGGMFPAIYWLQKVIFNNPFWISFQIISPVIGFKSALADYYSSSGGINYYWLSLGCICVMAIAAVVVAALALPVMWRDKKQRAENRRARVRRRNSELLQAAWRRPVFYQNPFHWLMVRRQRPPMRRFRGGAIIMVALVMIWGIFLAASILGSMNKEAFVGCLFTAYALHVVGKSLMAIESTRQLSDDRQSGGLELLLVTPLKEIQILSGHGKAFSQICRRLFRLLAVLNLAMLLTVLTCPERLSMRGRDQVMFFELFLGGFLALVFDWVAIRAAGPWFALRHGKHSRAIAGLLARLFLPNWAAVLVVIFIMQGGMNTDAGVAMTFGAWFMASFFNAAILKHQAERGLARGFRSVLSREKEKVPEMPLPRAWPKPVNA